MKQTLFKTLALTVFISGIITFVYYESKDAVSFQGSPNGGVVASENDTLTQAQKDSVELTLMRSSKVHIPTKNPLKTAKTDSLKETEREERLMYGSKSYIPAPKKNEKETTADTLKTANKKG